jgi:hypothetical protein
MCSVLIRVLSSRFAMYDGVMLANRTNRIDTLREEPIAYVHNKESYIYNIYTAVEDNHDLRFLLQRRQGRVGNEFFQKPHLI